MMKLQPLDLPMAFGAFLFGFVLTTVLSNMGKELAFIPMFLGGSFGIVLIMYRYGWAKEIQEDGGISQ